MNRLILAGVLASALSAPAAASPADDARAVAALDTTYQAAVKANDGKGMAAILHPDFVLVLGSGAVVDRATLLKSATDPTAIYERQEEDPGTQVVRVYGDTAVVTARLWLKGHAPDGSGAFDRRLWFSDTYVRTPKGWRYAFGQASSALPPAK
ncbi:MAG TPA: nuclear transport factor 2 family protein [Phenylobacterium sp.]|jgi:ketosteroid isomerase-like protein